MSKGSSTSAARPPALPEEPLAGVYVLQNGRFVLASSRLARIFGYQIEELSGRPVMDLVAPESRELVERQLARRLSGEEEAVHYSFQGMRKDGERLEVEVLGWRVEHNGAPAVRGMLLDVSERSRSARALRQSEEYFRSLIENALDFIVVIASDGTIRYESPSLERFLGYLPQERIGRSVLEFIHPDDVPRAREVFSRIDRFGPGSIPITYRVRRRDGSWRVFEAVGKNRLDDPAIAGVIINSRDITDRKLLEDQLRQAQKMEAIGRLAGGVAHDFNNLLTAILGYAGLLLAQDGIPEPVKEAITEIHKAGDRASSLTRQLLAFSRKQLLVPEILDLNAIVRDLEKMLRRLIGEDVALVTALGADLDPVLADPGQIEQVILNLVVNSRDAMPSGGTLTLKTRAVSLDQAFVQAHEGSRPGRHVMLSVQDTGVGMDAATRSHIFEPFFTTKEKGKGTGLGLATVYGIVKQSGGYVSVESELGRGAEFCIFLPSAEGTPRAAGIPASVPSAGGNETILLVEDDELVRKLAHVLLERGGYAVTDARNGREAIEKIQGAGKAFDLILTDLVMPEMSGPEFVRRIASSGHSPRVLYMSGYADNTLLAGEAIESRDLLLHKPFTPDLLLRRVRESLDRPGTRRTGPSGRAG